MKSSINVAVIGLGGRGTSLIEACILPREEVRITAVCDPFEDKRAEALKIFEKAGRPKPHAAADYREILARPDIDAVVIAPGWVPHIDIACASMRAGKYTACEVGGAYSIDDCWRLVRTHEETGTECMLLENCCFGRYELLTLNMVRQGLFGEIVHCSGGYHHDLREALANSPENRHYRLNDYIHRNCENYPTHELGPIANVLNINRGNRMLKLSSTASKAAGLHEYIMTHKGGSDVSKSPIAQGDIVTTVITCAGGETIVLTLDTTLPRAYSRGFQVRGTKGMVFEDSQTIFLDSEHHEFEFNGKGLWGNVDKYFEKYEHPIWKACLEDGLKGGHGGMDWLEFTAFFRAVMEGNPTPIDVYDMAAWMSITSLSEDSIARGGIPVAIPDFTNGRWMTREPMQLS